MTELQPGTAIGGYQVLGTLGTGGVATVYRVRETASGNDFALKLAHADVDREIQQTLIDEAAILQEIRNHFVVRAFGTLEHQGCPGLVMELVDGPALDEWHAEQAGPLSIQEVLWIFKKVAMGLASCHRDRVVHRDIKPENILLGPGMTPKLTDFGMAKRLGGGHLDSRRGLSRFYKQFGTPEYMPPEQVTSAELADGRADLWSMGILLYELLCDRPPFEGSRQEIFTSSALGDYKPAGSLRADVSPELDALVGGLLEAEVEDRTQDVGAVLTALQQLIA